MADPTEVNGTESYKVVEDSPQENCLSFKKFRELLLYKLDRTIAILGIIALGTLAIVWNVADNQITMAAITGLVGYAGVKSAK